MKTCVIAEIGVNHNGDLKLAEKMVDEAVRCGADIVKFQTGIPENIISKEAPKAEYQKVTTGSYESQLEMVKRVSLSFDDFVHLKRYCDRSGAEFLSTPFDLESIDFLDGLGVRVWKIPSGEITNLPYLEKIAATKKPVIMSTGMAEIHEIQDAIDVLKKGGVTDVTLLHCTTEYPAPIDDVNLCAMDHLRDTFGTEVGYSDHTEGIEVAVAAVARGASVIEKHFTLDRNMEGPDHKASIEPEQFSEMVRSIRNVECALGSYEKKPAPSELKNKAVARKSIVAATDIKAGDVFSEDNLTTKRPGTGISPMKWYELIGTKAKRDYKEGELI